MCNDGAASDGVEDIGGDLIEGGCAEHIGGGQAVNVGWPDVALRVDQCRLVALDLP